MLTAALMLFTDWRAPYPHVVTPLYGSGEVAVSVSPVGPGPQAVLKEVRLTPAGDFQTQWTARLPVYPSITFLSESGAAVAIGRYPAYGPEHALMIVNRKGTLLADLSLRDFLPAPAIRSYQEAQAKVEGFRYANWFKSQEAAFHCSNQLVDGFLPRDMRHSDPGDLSPDILLLPTIDGGRLAVDTKTGKVAPVRS